MEEFNYDISESPIDETNLEEEYLELFINQSKLLRKNFTKRRINFYSCNTKADARILILDLILKFKNSKGMTKVGIADSVTLHQLEIFDHMKSIKDLKIINPFERLPDGKFKIFKNQPPGQLDLPKDEYYRIVSELFDIMRESIISDIFIIGANAITRNGQIVSTDGTGNRVAGMIFGPKKVIIVVGKNKIVADLDAAIKRNRDVAAPLNYLRHNKKHHNRFDNPCMKLGYCTDCNSPRRGCLNTVIIDGATEGNKERIHLVLINDSLGF